MREIFTKEQANAIDSELHRLFDEHKTYAEFIESLYSTSNLTNLEKIIAAFIAGETVCRLKLSREISMILDGRMTDDDCV